MKNPQRHQIPGPPLDHATALDVDMVSYDAMARILQVCGLRVAHDICPELLWRELNNLINGTVSQQLSRRITKRELERLETYLEKYVALARSLQQLGDFPPMPPAEWLRETRAWIDAVEFRLTERSSGGPTPAMAMNHWFMPRLLALFETGFGETPTSTDDRAGSAGAGKAVRFVSELVAHVSYRIRLRGFSEVVDEPAETQVTKSWQHKDSSTYGKWIEKAKLLLSPTSAEFIGPLDPDWRRWARYYCIALISREQSPKQLQHFPAGCFGSPPVRICQDGPTQPRSTVDVGTIRRTSE